MPTLDGVRGLAILLVLWDHTRGLAGWNTRLISTFLPGHFGVDIFFVLSGFLITRILLADKAKGSPIRFFLYRRFLRIFPIYYLMLLVLLVASPGPDIFWAGCYLSCFHLPLRTAVSSPLQHTWSLSVEEHFYLVWPFLIYLLSRQRAIACALALLVGSLALAFVLSRFEAMRPLILHLSFCRLGSLVIGGIFAFYEGRLHQHPQRVSWAIFLGLLASAAIGVSGAIFRPPHAGEILILAGGLPASAAVVLLGIRLHGSGSFLGCVLSWRALTYVGAISYGLYLYHYPIFYYLGLLTPGTHPALLYALAIGLSFAASILSYKVIEQPILRLKDRFQARPKVSQDAESGKARQSAPTLAVEAPC